MVREVFTTRGMPAGGINNNVVSMLADKLLQGMFGGYGNTLDDVDYNSPDYNMMYSLEKNVWHFSAAKNHAQLVELSRALIDDGKLRSWDKFKAAALQINDRYIVQHLKTEYNLAVAGGQMAGKWVDIEAHKEALPLLEFDAVLDKQTTDLCRSLHGTVLPVDHPFWKTYYPPNHFSCRSTVRQRHGVSVTPAEKIPSAEIPKMFKTNLAQQGLIFPRSHPYFDGLPQSVTNAADTLRLTKKAGNG